MRARYVCSWFVSLILWTLGTWFLLHHEEMLSDNEEDASGEISAIAGNDEWRERYVSRITSTFNPFIAVLFLSAGIGAIVSVRQITFVEYAISLAAFALSPILCALAWTFLALVPPLIGIGTLTVIGYRRDHRVGRAIAGYLFCHYCVFALVGGWYFVVNGD